MRRVEEYILDVPMEIGRNFLPRPEICIPTMRLPNIHSFTSYTFAVENQAREMYDKRNEVAPPKEVAVESLYSYSAAHSMISSEVLQPTRITGDTSRSVPLLPATTNLMNFEEFELKGNVFDELEWKTIDDKTALSQVLSASSEPSTPAPDLTAPKALPSYPSLSFKVPQDKTVNAEINGSVPEGSKAMPRPLSSSTLSQTSGSGTEVSTKDLYRSRLLTKGYRENLVEETLENLPRRRWVHIEYYIKALSTLQKLGVMPSLSMRFLNQCDLTDKQAVLDRSQEVASAISQGSSAEDAFKRCLEKYKSQ